MSHISVPKRDGEEIRLQWSEYEGHTYLDIRLWFLGDDGEWHATKKGVTVPPGCAEEFLAAVERLVRHKQGKDPRQRELPLKKGKATRVRVKAQEEEED